MPKNDRALTFDPLSDVLSALQLRSDVFARTEASGPWSILFPRGPARFHLIERGEAWLTADGVKEPVHARGGDLLVLPHGDKHTLSDRVGRRGTSLLELLRTRPPGSDGIFRVGEGEGRRRADAVLSCGRFHLDPDGQKILVGALPPLLHVRARRGDAGDVVHSVLRIFMRETRSDAPGAVLASARLVDLLLIHAIRSWLAERGDKTVGWLGAMRDPHVGAALAKMHATPERAWTVDELAMAVGLSRSPFAARFRSLVGEPPLKYLTRWRMHAALRMLRDGKRVHDVAEAVGYDSESAFSRAFKKYVGASPVKLRHSEAASAR
jgi:AraC family transcriptional regulator, alkane utilization regulator